MRKIFFVFFFTFLSIDLFAQLFITENHMGKFEHSIELGISKGTDPYNFSSYEIEVINSYHWQNFENRKIGVELGLGTGVHYGTAFTISDRVNYDYQSWDGLLVPVYFQLKFYFPFRKTYRMFTPIIGTNWGHMFDISNKKVPNFITDQPLSEDMEGLLIEFFVGAELYTVKKTKFYFLIGLSEKNNKSMYRRCSENLNSGDDKLDDINPIMSDPLSSLYLRLGIKF